MQLTKNSLLQGGKYRIVNVLGQGGFGITYLGEHVALRRKVAIKEFYMKEYCERNQKTSHVSLGTKGSHELVKRFRCKFMKEVQNIAMFDHPHIIRIYDVFEENGTAYYVMEYHENGSLSDYIKKHKRLDESEALQYICQIADALDYIHRLRMMHLDIKPGNVLISDERKAVLIDFGMSKRYDEGGDETSTTPVGISHGYAPLEQYNSGGVGTFSAATDIYSLGATLYKMLTGLTPPDATTVMNDGLPLFPKGISKNTKNAVKQAMQPMCKRRPQNIKEFLKMIENKDDDAVDENTIVEDAEVQMVKKQILASPKSSAKRNIDEIRVLKFFIVLVFIVVLVPFGMFKCESNKKDFTVIDTLKTDSIKKIDTVDTIESQKIYLQKRLDKIKEILEQRADNAPEFGA